MIIAVSGICSAFEEHPIGSKVIWERNFMELLEKEITKHDFSSDRIPGQAYLVIPGAEKYVLSGQGTHTQNPDDYELRLHRGKVHTFLKKHRAEPTVEVAAVVYTKAAYLSDPDILEDGGVERGRIIARDPDYVLVTVLASSVKSAPMSPYRFVKNLAGGNYEALAWTADEIREKARAIATHADAWGTVVY